MTSQNFSRPGAIDLSRIASAAAAPQASPASGAAPAAAGAYVVDLTEASFDSIVRQSLQFPVVLELTSPRAHGAAQLSADLEALSDAAAGAWLLARVDVDAEPRVAQALGVQAVPMVVAVIGGQLAPLFQGTKPRAEIQPYLDEVLKLAVANGIVGRAKPGAGRPGTESAALPEEEPGDPRFAAADEALAAGDFGRAVAEFDKVLASAPGDAEAIAGRAQAALLERSMAFDPQQVVARAADPDDVDAQLDAADLELINGQPEAAFARLIDVIRDTSGDERERVRVRLLELFETVGRTDPSVLAARRALSTALF
ncbi:MAG TPA: tetratricopeptide repeat protein [Propionibacteriaceae bacterium]|nr:tetratricopeptide repeat protein [Propionibacteriaceae bacterium]